MGSKQRSVRLPEEWWQYIDDLPDDFGTDSTEKLKQLLAKGMKRMEQERRWINEGEAREVAERQGEYGPDDPGKHSNAAGAE